MEHIEVSVIVPVYNVKPYLKECVDSILSQQFDQPFELLLIDDGATDGSGALCDELAAQDERVRVIHQVNMGLSAGRNTGMDNAQGRYYAFVDADDKILPGYLQKLYDACEKHDAYMAVCGIQHIQEDGSLQKPPRNTLPAQVGVFRGKDLLNLFFTPEGIYYTVAWNKMYRANIWHSLHYPHGRLHEDEFVAHRLFWRCDKVVCLNEVLCCYRSRNGSITTAAVRPASFDSVDGLVDRYRFYVENRADRSVIDEAYAACWRRYLFLCGQIRVNPSEELLKAIAREQFTMQGLVSYLPNCKLMKMTDKLSATRWSMMPVSTLIPLKAESHS